MVFVKLMKTYKDTKKCIAVKNNTVDKWRGIDGMRSFCNFSFSSFFQCINKRGENVFIFATLFVIY